MSIGKAISMEDAIRKLMVVSESLEQYEDVESMSLSMLVSDCIDYLREKQLEKKWHTGTPTEEGEYWVAFRWGLDNEIMHEMASHILYGATTFKQGTWLIDFPYVVEGWMPITPFEASKEN